MTIFFSKRNFSFQWTIYICHGFHISTSINVECTSLNKLGHFMPYPMDSFVRFTIDRRQSHPPIPTKKPSYSFVFPFGIVGKYLFSINIARLGNVPSILRNICAGCELRDFSFSAFFSSVNHLFVRRKYF